MYKSFRTDRQYLTNYHAKSLMVFCALNVIGFLLAPPNLKELLAFGPGILLLSSSSFVAVLSAFIYCAGAALFLYGLQPSIPVCLGVSVLFCLNATAILHNASHGNIRPAWLRRPVGELFGFIQLVGFADWAVVHVIHHAHPDDPERDPHPPVGLGYWKFLIGMRASILKVLLKEYFQLWGDGPESKTQLIRLALISRAEQVAKIVLWFMILKPEIFTWFFVSSIVLKMMHYAWFNYATHIPDGDQVKIVNLQSNLYRIANFFSYGLYFHRNHHLNPKLFNPSKMIMPSESVRERSPRTEGIGKAA